MRCRLACWTAIGRAGRVSQQGGRGGRARWAGGQANLGGGVPVEIASERVVQLGLGVQRLSIAQKVIVRDIPLPVLNGLVVISDDARQLLEKGCASAIAWGEGEGE